MQYHKKSACKFFRWFVDECAKCVWNEEWRKKICAMWHPKSEVQAVLFVLVMSSSTLSEVMVWIIMTNASCAFCWAVQMWTNGMHSICLQKSAWMAYGIVQRSTCSWFMIYVAKQTWNLNCPILSESAHESPFGAVQRQHDFLVNWFKWATHLDDRLSTARGNHSRSAIGMHAQPFFSNCTNTPSGFAFEFWWITAKNLKRMRKWCRWFSGFWIVWKKITILWQFFLL